MSSGPLVKPSQDARVKRSSTIHQKSHHHTGRGARSSTVVRATCATAHGLAYMAHPDAMGSSIVQARTEIVHKRRLPVHGSADMRVGGATERLPSGSRAASEDTERAVGVRGDLGKGDAVAALIEHSEGAVRGAAHGRVGRGPLRQSGRQLGGNWRPNPPARSN